MHDYNHRKHPLVGDFGCIHGSCPPPGALSRDGKDPKPRNHLFTINNVSHASVVQLAHPSLCTGMCPPPTTQTMRYGLSQACAARSSIPGSQIYSFWCGPHGGSDAGPRLLRGQNGRNMVYTGPNHREESQDSIPIRPIHPPATPSIAQFTIRQFSHEMLCGFMAATNPATGRLLHDDGTRNLNSSRPHSTPIHVHAELCTPHTR